MTFAEGLSVERGLDDLRFKVYFDLMLGLLLNTVFFLALFRYCVSVCVQNLQSIIQLKLISYSVRLCNNTHVFRLHPRQKLPFMIFSFMMKKR